MRRVLLIEHEAAVAELARRYLAREGLTVQHAGTPEGAAAALAEIAAGRYRPDAVVLDLTMPGLNPREIRRGLGQLRRESGARAGGAGRPRGAEPGAVPVICLTGPGGLRPREAGASAAAWLRRPFGPRDLTTQVRTVLAVTATAATLADTAGSTHTGITSARGNTSATAAEHADSGAGPGAGTAAAGGGRAGVAAAMQPFADVALTATERELLAFLLASPGRVFTRERLLAAVREAAGGRGGHRGVPAGEQGRARGRAGRSRAGAGPAGPRAVDVYVAQLRAKLGNRSPIRTVRGVGYSADL